MLYLDCSKPIVLVIYNIIYIYLLLLMYFFDYFYIDFVLENNNIYINHIKYSFFIIYTTYFI